MRRPLVIYDFAPDFWIPFTWGKFYFLFYQCTSHSFPISWSFYHEEYSPCHIMILQHSGIWGAADEAVLNIVHEKKKILIIWFFIFLSGTWCISKEGLFGKFLEAPGHSPYSPYSVNPWIPLIQRESTPLEGMKTTAKASHPKLSIYGFVCVFHRREVGRGDIRMAVLLCTFVCTCNKGWYVVSSCKQSILYTSKRPLNMRSTKTMSSPLVFVSLCSTLGWKREDLSNSEL